MTGPTVTERGSAVVAGRPDEGTWTIDLSAVGETPDAALAQVADRAAALMSLLDELGIPLTPVRLKCALLGLGVLKVALHRAKGTKLPDEWAGLDELELK